MSTGQPSPPLQKPPGYRDPNLPIPRHGPPKPTTLPPSFQQHKSHRRAHCCRTFCCTILILILILTLILFTAGAFFYLFFQPRMPEFRLESADVEKFDVRRSPGGPTLDSRITARVRVKNPNQKLKMSYEKIRVLVNAAKGGAVLGVGSARGFTQERNNVTSLKVDVNAENGILGNADADELEKGFKSKNLSVNVEISGKVGIKGDKWSAGSVGLKVVCEGVRLISRVERQSPKCRIKVLCRLINSTSYSNVCI
ncbi:late embryogenesis abundant protein [Striga asiatica]|uniref:Late embryogenesis abundant protein n=1 Tax=Striga asiatica TaxID=4170 RepID=A0A5A7P0Z4_STRAF|nr:late embryogenesis abundant protein [Striga asiatica]